MSDLQDFPDLLTPEADMILDALHQTMQRAADAAGVTLDSLAIVYATSMGTQQAFMSAFCDEPTESMAQAMAEALTCAVVDPDPDTGTVALPRLTRPN